MNPTQSVFLFDREKRRFNRHAVGDQDMVLGLTFLMHDLEMMR
jgi:hypothetical protein